MKAYIVTVPARHENVKTMSRDLSLIPCVDQIVPVVDTDGLGIWGNTARALDMIVNDQEPALLCQDDLKLSVRPLLRALPVLTSQTKRYHMISLFTPPQQIYETKLAKGFDGSVGNYFLWGQMCIMSPDMAEASLVVDRFLDPSVVKYHDEPRYRAASYMFDMPIVILTRSYCHHDVTMPSMVGTPAQIAGNVRDTRTMATGHEDYSKGLKLFARNDSKVTELFLPEALL